MSFPRYPTYKDSGVEWLGAVPEHWSVEPFKRQIERNDGGVWGDEPDGIADTFVLRSTEQSSDGRWQIDDPAARKLSESEINGSLLVEGDLLLTKSSGSSLHIGKTTLVTTEIAEMRCCYSNFMQRIRMRPSFLPKLAWHVMNNDLARLQFDLLSNSSTGLANLNATMIGQIIVPVPPLPEQTQIAAFLDHETAKIDALVAEQRRLMDLLKEKRQAVISHAVTRGLNPDAPMKASGVEWLGDVPEHWEVTPLKYVVSLRSGGTPSKTNTAYWDGDVPWASSKDLKVEMLSDTQDHITQKAVDEGAADLVPAGSLLIVVRGMILIHTFPVVKAAVPMAINQDLKALTPSANLDVDFLAWLLRGSSKETLGRIDEAAHGTKVLRLEAWTSIALPIPPIDEQLTIVRAISEGMGQFDTLTAEAQRAIDLLQERRTALISAAVTGQIDVRSTAAPAVNGEDELAVLTERSPA